MRDSFCSICFKTQMPDNLVQPLWSSHFAEPLPLHFAWDLTEEIPRVSASASIIRIPNKMGPKETDRSKALLFFQCLETIHGIFMHFPDHQFCAAGHRFWRCCDAVSSGSLPLRNHWCWGGKWAATMPWFAGEVLVKCVWEYPTCKLSRRNQSVYIQDGVLNTDPSRKKGIKKSSP